MAKMKVVEDKISLSELKKMAKKMFGNLVKAVVDIEKEIMVVNGELHADEEALMIERGSQQRNLWGINFYPDKKGKDFIEFDSIVNLRPVEGNRSRGVDDPKIKNKIIQIVKKLVK